MSHTYYQLPHGRIANIEGDCAFPPLSAALAEPNGLLAIGGDLSVARLLSAYQQGIFPWFSEGEPVMWWSPNPRMVLFPNELKISNSLKKTLKNSSFEIRFNSAFHQVISACRHTARAGQPGTWITSDIIEAYCSLHQAGYAISMESWLNNQLVGGCYGIKIGRMFYGESMFHHVTDASKVALVHLVKYLQSQGVGLIDCQMKTPLLASFGGREIPRDKLMQQLLKLIEF
ncbi:MAG: leucyl/phenylalanyl-tRNA--protein transferase [Methylotenera sp.]|nr:leucyl/phenylalanyl-tRNA--protein transferase [Methylotenera sp.]MSP99249.1 leucyl/phenylalanyl-tRNA--protein transferase [Methylotenera sp.]